MVVDHKYGTRHRRYSVRYGVYREGVDSGTSDNSLRLRLCHGSRGDEWCLTTPCGGDLRGDWAIRLACVDGVSGVDYATMTSEIDETTLYTPTYAEVPCGEAEVSYEVFCAPNLEL